MTKQKTRTLTVALFPYFELLDVCGPLEMFGNLGESLQICLAAEQAGPVASTQGPSLVADKSFADVEQSEMILIPGGVGTRQEVNNTNVTDWITGIAANAELVMTVCTGTALLARTGLLDGKRATTNKRAFQWVVEQGPNVEWVGKARWVEDGRFFTSSGVSAGIDMSLAVIEKLWGSKAATELEHGTEYDRHRDSSWDPFAALNGIE